MSSTDTSTDTGIDIEGAIQEMAEQIAAHNPANPILIGIHTGGVWIAQRLQRILDYNEPLGSLDISFYRDDFSRVGLNPEVKSSELPVAIEDRNIILIDDVLYTGRTIRAAMNEIFSYGRPNQVKLGVLIERSGREIPIQADFVGYAMDQLDESRQVKLTNENGKLELNVIKIGASKTAASKTGAPG